MIDANDVQLWKDFLEASRNYRVSKETLRREAKNLAEVGRYGLENHDIVEALEIIKSLPKDDLRLIADKLLERTSYFNGFTKTFEEILFLISPEWLIDNIEKYAEPILSQEDPYEEYGRLFYIYGKLHKDLVIRLAHRATQHPDEEIRSMGIETLKKVESA